ncbi:DHH phosphoesterase [Panus rudis PR-1116 ss-1]|nr:DHH phosphoesterase [Panus rudis PR-1116 ss-1]
MPSIGGVYSSDSEEDTSIFTEWPAPRQDLEAARKFLKECASSNLRTVILPDKDADGLCASLIIYRSLIALGLSPSCITIHFVAKGSNVHSKEERARISDYSPRFVISVDQGSRGGPSLAEGDDVKTLVVDHHWSDQFPAGSQVLSAAKCPPVAPSSTLAYVLCRSLHPSIRSQTDYLCAIGTMGDLGSSLKWEHPWPGDEMKECFKKYGKKTLSDVVGIVNAPRRTARYDVESAWQSLLNTTDPSTLLNITSTSPLYVKRLHEARLEVKSEIDRCARSRPYFSGDGRVALVRVKSGAQVHPVIATRWANSLKSSKLEIVMCANDGYLPGMTNFSCRVARCSKDRSKSKKAITHSKGEVNIIETLIEYAKKDPGLREAMGCDFARGHKEASGGIVPNEQFERLWKVMLESAPVDGGSPKKKQKITQKNTLEGWVERTT